MTRTLERYRFMISTKFREKFLIFALPFILVIAIFTAATAIAQEETEFSGNLRFGYVNMKDTEEVKYEDSFSIDFLELMVKKSVGSFGVFANYRLGDFSNRLPETSSNDTSHYLYEGWISYTVPGNHGTIKAGLVPVPFGIFENGLYYPRGILYEKNWMWNYSYGASYTLNYLFSDTFGFNAGLAYLNRENSENELAAYGSSVAPQSVCLGERDAVSGRLGANLGIEGLLELKAGGSAQFGKLKREGQDEADDKLGLAGDLTIINPFMIPVTLLGEFVNYSFGADDDMKGNTFMAQADITPLQNIGMLDKITLSLHASMDMPKDKALASKISLIGQLMLQLDKMFFIYAQVFADKIEEAEELMNQGIRVWFMYMF